MDYVMIADAASAREAQQALSLSRLIAFDIETQGLDPYRDAILLYAFKGETGPVYLARPGDHMGELLRCFDGRTMLSHNAAFEYMFMALNHPFACAPLAYFDTALAEKVITNGILSASAGLDAVAKKYLGIELPKELQKSWIGMPLDQEPTPEQLAYAAGDVSFLHHVMREQLRWAKREGLMPTLRLEMAVLPAFAEMRLAGFKLNVEKHRQTVKDYVKLEGETRKNAELALDPLWLRAVATQNEERLINHTALDTHIRMFMAMAGYKRVVPAAASAPFKTLIVGLRKERDKWKPKKVERINLGSQQQVLAALAVVGIEPKLTEPNGDVKPSLDKNVLREWQHEELIRVYSAWAKPAKVLSTYCETLLAQVNPVTGRVHSDFNQIINSGRCSSKQPNMQNMPPDVRANFEAAEGNTLIVADAKNQEGRLAAILANDKNLLNLFRTGGDWHCETAALAYPHLFKSGKDVPKDAPERAGCKNANFSGIYGGTAHTLYKRGYVPTLAVGEVLMEASYSFAPQVRAKALAVADRAITEGVAETIIGRKRYFRLPPKPRYSEDPKSAYQNWKRVRGGIRRAAMNHPVQGSGADIMKQAMVLLLPYMLSIGGKQVAFVHDELVYEVPLTYGEEAAKVVAEKMEEAAAMFTDVLPIPGEVHITASWRK